VDEYGAAPARNARPSIVIELDDEVIEVIVAPEAIAWFIGRPDERTIVSPVCRRLAPSVVAADTPHRQRSPRPRLAISPPPNPHRRESSARGATITFALIRFDAAAAKRNRQHPEAGAH